MKTLNSFSKLALLCAVILISVSTSCKRNRNNDTTTPEITGPDVSFYALAANNQLMNINAKNPSAIVSQRAITGLQANETILSIDFRPATGELYGVGSTSRIYVINAQTGAARAMGISAFTPAISSNTVAIDFNPTVDRIRLVTSTGQNLRLNPETGGVAATDGTINGVANASVTAVAYTQNRAGATATVLFDIDATNDKLYRQDPPNDGKLVEVGSLGVDATATGGFDINFDGTAALAALTVGGKAGLYSIDLTTGKATKIMGDLPAPIISMAVPTEMVAYAINSNNELVIFNPAAPALVTKTMSGLQAGETVVGLDFRPANGQLYALGSSSRIYVVNTSSGAATAVGTAPLTTLLAGVNFGFDFNPTVDRIRVVSNTGQNLRLNPNDGLVAAIDGALSPGTPAVSAAAYTNNFAGATTTVLYDIDTQTNRLYRQDPPNNGVLVDVGALGVTATATNGFDIGSTSGTAYALLTVGGATGVYTINLQTGAATRGATLAGTYRAFTLGLGF